MDHGVPRQIVLRSQKKNIGFSALTAIFVAAAPKCPICWMTIMSALGISSSVNAQWLRPLAIVLLCLPLSALLLSARRRQGYGPFFLALAAAISMYLCKFTFSFDVGVYLSGGALLSASIWSALPKRQAEDNLHCHC